MRTAVSIATLVFILTVMVGCKDQNEATVYTIPKESTSPPPSAPMSPPVMDMARQQLPESALNQDGSNPTWQVPEAWEILPASSMRRASFRASGTAGAVDIAVTTFPGDVGGLLANLNRWRGQVGAAPLTADQVEDNIERLAVGGKPVIVSRIEGSGQSTQAAIFEHGGHSWFFKMTGPTATVNEQSDAFIAYIKSVEFPDA